MLNKAMQKKILSLIQRGFSTRGASKVTGVPKSTVHDLVVRNRKEDAKTTIVSKTVIKGGGGVKRVLVLADPHCGHKFGLTHPDWFVPGTGPGYMSYLRESQEEAWDFYSSAVKSLGKVDVLIVAGDAVDGKAFRSGGTEQLTCSMAEQRDIAEACLREVNTDKIFMVHGTPYHTASDGEDNESLISERLDATIDDHLWLDINGIVFDVKHKVGSSSVPHGRATSLAKEYVWNRQWAEIKGQPKADIFLRAHVHYHTYVGSPEYLAMTLPPLQMPNTKFGSRQCSGTVDFGMVYFDIPEDSTSIDDITWNSKILRIKSIAPKLIKV